MAAFAPGDDRSLGEASAPLSITLPIINTEHLRAGKPFDLTVLSPHADSPTAIRDLANGHHDCIYERQHINEHNDDDEDGDGDEDAQSFHSSTSTPPPPGLPPVISPPYWQHTRPPHNRATSQVSVASSGKQPAHIRLEDHTETLTEGVRSPLWARVVHITTHTVIEGTVRGVGDYVVWICNVETYDGGTVVLRRRYSEFEALREQLRATFPYAAASLPSLPPKSVLYKFRPAFLEKRRQGLEYFLNCVLLNPEFASSAILKEFVFS